ncbi:MAG: hypothetical protein IKH64_08815 [Prevotella sp.]|nr:hypothetical protein [Prevotella sp.]
MNKYKDSDLREALRRREMRRPQIEVPDDFCDQVMQKIEQREKRKRAWLYPTIAAAAVALLLLTIHFGNTSSVQQDVTDQPTIVEKVHRSVMDKNAVQAIVAREDKHSEAVLARDSKSVHRKESNTSVDVTEPTDSMFKQIAWVEAELERVGDSIYMDKLTKTIHYDPKLSKMVNDFFITANDTLFNKDSIKTI